MADLFAGGYLRFQNGAWRDDDGDIVDAVEVVRCQECVLSRLPKMVKYVGEYVNCTLYTPMPMMRCDDFCSYGEREI